MERIINFLGAERASLLSAVLLGSGAYVAFVVLQKRHNLTVKFVVLVLFINLFVTYLFSELLKVFKWGAYKDLILPLVSYGGQNLVDWFDKRYMKLLDAGAKKVGLNIDTDDMENNNPNISDDENDKFNR